MNRFFAIGCLVVASAAIASAQPATPTPTPVDPCTEIAARASRAETKLRDWPALARYHDANSTTNPGTLPNSNGTPLPTYVRHFNGSYFYFLQNIINTKHQIIIKYDWYDPNIKVKKTDIGKSGTNLTAADIKYSTLGIGYVYYFNPQTKIIFYYDIVTNELTNLSGATTDQKDNVFTCRLQFRF